MINKLLGSIGKFYQPASYPCLERQIQLFSKTKPFDGVSIVHAVPLYHNTIVKAIPLIAGGADVRFTTTRGNSYSNDAVTFLEEHGFPFYHPTECPTNGVHLFLDCVGTFADLTPLIGAVELTRSGEHYYENSTYPVFSVDRSPLKLFEDRFGTADGFARALQKLKIGFNDGDKAVIFGFGKVGSGIAEKAVELGCKVTVVELPERITHAEQYDFIRFDDTERVLKAVNEATIVITCTGVKGVVQANYDIDIIINSKAILVNMGGEDEYGGQMPESRVLNFKRPVNFVLDEPTRLTFLDPVFALHNACALYLILKGRSLAVGIQAPPKQLEDEIVQTPGMNNMRAMLEQIT